MKHQLEPLSGGRIACTKKCYERAIKASMNTNDDGDDRKGSWFTDGKPGPDDPNTSMKILLDWWMEEGNYSKYCGKNNDGVKKKQFCDILAARMSKETMSSRDGKSVKSKIEHVERAWRKAHEFATSATGAGIQATDGVSKFEELVKKKCPFYYDIIEVMQDRASSRPKVTNYDLDMEDDEAEMNLLGDDGGVSEMSDTESTIPNSVANSVAGSKRPSDHASRSSAKKARAPRKSPSSTTLVDDDLSSSLAEANRAAAERFSEMQRHNKALEDIESQRLYLEKSRVDSMSWKTKSEELDYQVKLISKYHEIKKKFGWSDNQILRHFPAMKSVIENENMSEEPNII